MIVPTLVLTETYPNSRFILFCELMVLKKVWSPEVPHR